MSERDKTIHEITRGITLLILTAMSAVNPSSAWSQDNLADQFPAVSSLTLKVPSLKGRIGQPYVIGKKDPVRFTLQSATYTDERVKIGWRLFSPTATTKLLLLRYSPAQHPKGAPHPRRRRSSLRSTR
jgi:hypothetical protein